jgi:serine/threonine protein kinase
VKWLSDAAVARLCDIADVPDLGDTRYEVLEKIGQGGMGTVYRALDGRLNRPVALKVWRGAADGAQERMLREARVIARLEHPGIVPIHDAGLLPDGRVYYAMKLVRGRRLDEAVSGSTDLAERLRIFHKVCEAVAFAHAHGVLHRDLKPQNIMLGPFGEVLVMDWGTAREGSAADPPRTGTAAAGPGLLHHTTDGTVLGTPGYMAPEQARGEIAHIDARTDVYGLGGVLFFLLTGHPPAGAGTIPQFDASCPRPLQAICHKALAADPAARYEGAADLGADVARFLDGLSVRAYPEGLLARVRRLASRYRVVIAVVGAYVLVRILILLLVGN